MNYACVLCAHTRHGTLWGSGSVCLLQVYVLLQQHAKTCYVEMTQATFPDTALTSRQTARKGFTNEIRWRGLPERGTRLGIAWRVRQ